MAAQQHNDADLESLIGRIADDFTRRHQRGESPHLDDYTKRFPELAEVLSDILPAIVALSPKDKVAGETPRANHTIGGDEPAKSPVTVGDYEILAEIGRGGMGTVYKARHRVLGRVVALKMLRSRDEADLQRFRHEAQAVARLQHPNVVQIFEVFEIDGQPFLALEYVDGGSLAERIKGEPQPPREAAALVETLARAIAAAHDRGVIHRDLKPSNVLLVRNGVVSGESSPTDSVRLTTHHPPLTTCIAKISDFGLVKRLDVDLGQTQTGAIVGTPSYMAPEQAIGGASVGPAADIFALGAILYELIAGRPPFKGPSVLETLELVRTADPTPPSSLQPGCPRDLETVCLKCLCKEPARRYASAANLADDLCRFLNGEPIHARPVGNVERLAKWLRRNRIVATMAAAVFLALLGGTAVAWIMAIRASASADDALVQKSQADASAGQARQEQQRAEASLQFARDSLNEMVSVFMSDLMLRQESLTETHKKYLRRVLALTERLTQETGADEQTRASVGKAFAGVGTIHQRLGELPEAETATKHAVEIFEQLAGDYPGTRYLPDLANARRILAVVYQQQSRWKEAEDQYRASLKAREGLLGPGFDLVHRLEWARTQQTFSTLLTLLGRHDEAERTLRSAHEACEQLAADFPDVLEHRRQHAHMSTEFGIFLAKRGQHLEAEKVLRAALALYEKLILDFPAVQHSTSYLENLGSTHYQLGELLLAARKYEEAEHALDKALSIQERLVAAYPGATAHRMRLARSLNDKGLVLMQDPRRSKDAEANLLRAVTLTEWLLANTPDDHSLTIGLGGMCCNIGALLRGRGELKTALSWYDRAVQTLKPVFHKEPQREMAKRFLRNSHWGRATIFDRLGRHQEALTDWDMAVSLADAATRDELRLPRAVTLARLHKTEQAVAEAEDLAQAKNAKSTVLYELARVYALCAAAPAATSTEIETCAVRAGELLRRAVAGGFKDWQRLDKDADFGALRQRDDFRKLRPSAK